MIKAAIYSFLLSLSLIECYGQGEALMLPKSSSTITIPSATIAGGFFRSMQYFSNVSGEYIAIHTYVNNEIDIFKYDDSLSEYRFYTTVVFKSEGPNAIPGNRTLGSFIVDANTIVVFNGVGKIHYFDWKGNKTNDIEYSTLNNNNRISSPHILQSAPVSINGNFLITSTAGGPDDWIFNEFGFAHNYKTGTSKGLIVKKDAKSGYFGHSNSAFFTHATASIKDGKALISFAYDNNIHEVNILGGDVINYPFKHPDIDKIKALSKNYRKISTARQERHLAKQGFYGEILSDKYNKKYYRFAYGPVKDFQTRTDAFKYPSIIVSDADFENLRAYKLTSDYREFGHIITPDGLCLWNEAKFAINEDELIFDCYKL